MNGNWMTLSVVTVYAVAAFFMVPLLAIDSGAGYYETKEVHIHGGPIILTGTLTLPKTDTPYACVVLQLAASQARMLEAQAAFGSNYLNQMAHELARDGIATLWYDMRGADLSDKEYLQFTLEDFADDALAAVRFLKQRPEIDSSRIGLCGLSEGGWTVALAASRSNMVDFLILLGSPGLPIEEVDRLQTEAMAQARGATEEEIRAMRLGSKQVYRASRSGKIDKALEAGIRKQVIKTLKNLPEEQKPHVDALVQAQINRILSPSFRYLLDFRPKLVFRKIQCPTLALYGEFDHACPPEAHQAPLKAAIESGGNTAFTTRTVPAASHIFTDVKTGPQELIPSEIVFAPGFPDVIANWILQRK